MHDTALRPGEVAVLHWPEDRSARERYRDRGVPRLLLVEPGHVPPHDLDHLEEDWARTTADRIEVHARLAHLATGIEPTAAEPWIDDGDLLRHRAAWVALGPSEARLARVLVDNFGTVVPGEALGACWEESPPEPTVRVAVRRLRRRVGAVGLTIRNVRGRGYVMDAIGGAAP